MVRASKGTVSVGVLRGRLRLRLPRHVFGGVQKYLSLELADTPQNRKVARAKAQQIEADIALERFDHTFRRYRSAYALANDEPPLAELWQKFAAEQAKLLEHSTIQTTYRTVKNHIEALPTQQIFHARLIRSHLKETLPPTAAKRTFTYIKACCAWALDEGVIASNPFQFLQMRSRKPVQEIDPFTVEERDQIIAAFAENYHYYYYTNFVRFCFLTGCRQSEAIALTWDKVRADHILFNVAYVLGKNKTTKTRKTRTFPINAQLGAVLSGMRPLPPPPNQLLFLAKQGGFIDSHNFLNRAWKGVLSTLPIRYRVAYNTRHSFITHCLDAGIPVATVAQWVGNSPRTIYAHYAGACGAIAPPVIEDE